MPGVHLATKRPDTGGNLGQQRRRQHLSAAVADILIEQRPARRVGHGSVPDDVTSPMAILIIAPTHTLALGLHLDSGCGGELFALPWAASAARSNLTLLSCQRGGH